jgi:dienelactone hydrolase
MRIILKVLLFLFTISQTCVAIAQTPQEIYRKPLAEVLMSVEKKYNVKLKYDEKLVKDLNVEYATWRFKDNVPATLDNILKPLNLVYRELDKSSYEIRQFEYYRRTEAEGKKHLDELLSLYSSAADFDKRKQDLKKCIASALGIKDVGKKTSLNPIFRPKLVMNGYSAENVAFESVPGYFVTGTLYRPTKTKGLMPVILNPHGHFYNEQDPSIAKDSGRYRADMQYRCAGLARMGAIVLSYDMYSWGESVLFTGGPSYHETSFAASIQTWNSMRALDFLLSLPNADKSRVAVTGASGGGTQTILVAALDDRVTVSVPVVMVSSAFYGGCPCESGLPIHDECNGHKTNNTEIAAMIAPKPLLIISDGDDWTQSVPGTDFPYLKKVYSLYGKPENVASVYLPDDKHDYGITKRVPMYRFMAKTLGLSLKNLTGKDGSIDESSITIQQNKDLLVFNKKFPLPLNALKSHDEIVKAFNEVQQ